MNVRRRMCPKKASCAAKPSTLRPGIVPKTALYRPQLLIAPNVRDGSCVKTCTSRECAELFSLFSSFDGDCQSGSFLIQRNRDKLSTRKPDVGVFTQSGPKADLRSSCTGTSGLSRSVATSLKRSHAEPCSTF